MLAVAITLRSLLGRGLPVILGAWEFQSSKAFCAASTTLRLGFRCGCGFIYWGAPFLNVLPLNHIGFTTCHYIGKP